MIALLTDFGHDEPYVGIMKAVIAGITPGVEMIDLSHLVSPGDVRRGAFLIWQAAKDLPQGTIFLGVVDPGVGTERKGICLESGRKTFIGPDNGLFTYVVLKENYTAWELSNPRYQLPDPASTFHGRDIFAPAAAHAAAGKKGSDFGPELAAIRLLPAPKFQIEQDRVLGEVLAADRFGNLFTSIGCFLPAKDSLHLASWIDSQTIPLSRQLRFTIGVQGLQLPLVKTFAEVQAGTCAGLIGSTGLLEIAANQGSASEILKIEPGTPVSLAWE